MQEIQIWKDCSITDKTKHKVTKAADNETLSREATLSQMVRLLSKCIMLIRRIVSFLFGGGVFEAIDGNADAQFMFARYL